MLQGVRVVLGWLVSSQRQHTEHGHIQKTGWIFGLREIGNVPQQVSCWAIDSCACRLCAPETRNLHRTKLNFPSRWEREIVVNDNIRERETEEKNMRQQRRGRFWSHAQQAVVLGKYKRQPLLHDASWSELTRTDYKTSDTSTVVRYLSTDQQRLFTAVPCLRLLHIMPPHVLAKVCCLCVCGAYIRRFQVYSLD